MNKPKALNIREIVRLRSDVYRDLEKKARKLKSMDSTVSSGQAFYELGIEHTLRLIREELVVDEGG